jgi:hypothetical protein
LYSANGAVHSFHSTSFNGTNASVVAAAGSIDHKGAWVLTSDKRLLALGDAPAGVHGTVSETGAPVALAPSLSGNGVLAVSSTGDDAPFGDAHAAGTLVGKHLNKPIVSAAYGSSLGYWFVGADGGVFSFGNVKFYGSLGAHPPASPIVAIAATNSGHGYWLVGADGSVYPFGDAVNRGSMHGKALNAPIAGIAATSTGNGYWLVGRDGGVFSFGDAKFYGSLGGTSINAAVVAITQ